MTAAERRYDTVFLDAFGTLITVDRPAQRLRAALSGRMGIEVDEAAAAAAFAAEAAHYATNCRRGADPAGLAVLHRECAAVLLEQLSIPADPAAAVELLGDAIVFAAYPDAPPALAQLSAAGVRLAVVSNADHTLPAMLRQAGIELEHVFDSATSRSSKPDPGIFRRALDALGADPRRTLHVGDTPAADGDGARAAGIDVRIIDRGGDPGPDTIAALTELPALVAGPAAAHRW